MHSAQLLGSKSLASSESSGSAIFDRLHRNSAHGVDGALDPRLVHVQVCTDDAGVDTLMVQLSQSDLEVGAPCTALFGFDVTAGRRIRQEDGSAPLAASKRRLLKREAEAVEGCAGFSGSAVPPAIPRGLFASIVEGGQLYCSFFSVPIAAFTAAASSRRRRAWRGCFSSSTNLRLALTLSQTGSLEIFARPPSSTAAKGVDGREDNGTLHPVRDVPHWSLVSSCDALLSVFQASQSATTTTTTTKRQSSRGAVGKGSEEHDEDEIKADAGGVEDEQNAQDSACIVAAHFESTQGLLFLALQDTRDTGAALNRGGKETTAPRGGAVRIMLLPLTINYPAILDQLVATSPLVGSRKRNVGKGKKPSERDTGDGRESEDAPFPFTPTAAALAPPVYLETITPLYPSDVTPFSPPPPGLDASPSSSSSSASSSSSSSPPLPSPAISTLPWYSRLFMSASSNASSSASSSSSSSGANGEDDGTASIVHPPHAPFSESSGSNRRTFRVPSSQGGFIVRQPTDDDEERESELLGGDYFESSDEDDDDDDEEEEEEEVVGVEDDADEEDNDADEDDITDKDEAELNSNSTTQRVEGTASAHARRKRTQHGSICVYVEQQSSGIGGAVEQKLGEEEREAAALKSELAMLLSSSASEYTENEGEGGSGNASSASPEMKKAKRARDSGCCSCSCACSRPLYSSRSPLYSSSSSSSPSPLRRESSFQFSGWSPHFPTSPLSPHSPAGGTASPSHRAGVEGGSEGSPMKRGVWILTTVGPRLWLGRSLSSSSVEEVDDDTGRVGERSGTKQRLGDTESSCGHQGTPSSSALCACGCSTGLGCFLSRPLREKMRKGQAKGSSRSSSNSSSSSSSSAMSLGMNCSLPSPSFLLPAASIRDTFVNASLQPQSLSKSLSTRPSLLSALDSAIPSSVYLSSSWASLETAVVAARVGGGGMPVGSPLSLSLVCPIAASVHPLSGELVVLSRGGMGGGSLMIVRPTTHHDSNTQRGRDSLEGAQISTLYPLPRVLSLQEGEEGGEHRPASFQSLVSVDMAAMGPCLYLALSSEESRAARNEEQQQEAEEKEEEPSSSRVMSTLSIYDLSTGELVQAIALPSPASSGEATPSSPLSLSSGNRGYRFWGPTLGGKTDLPSSTTQTDKNEGAAATSSPLGPPASFFGLYSNQLALRLLPPSVPSYAELLRRRLLASQRPGGYTESDASALALRICAIFQRQEESPHEVAFGLLSAFRLKEASASMPRSHVTVSDGLIRHAVEWGEKRGGRGPLNAGAGSHTPPSSAASYPHPLALADALVRASSLWEQLCLVCPSLELAVGWGISQYEQQQQQLQQVSPSSPSASNTQAIPRSSKMQWLNLAFVEAAIERIGGALDPKFTSAVLADAAASCSAAFSRHAPASLVSHPQNSLDMVQQQHALPFPSTATGIDASEVLSRAISSFTTLSSSAASSRPRKVGTLKQEEEGARPALHVVAPVEDATHAEPPSKVEGASVEALASSIPATSARRKVGGGVVAPTVPQTAPEQQQQKTVISTPPVLATAPSFKLPSLSDAIAAAAAASAAATLVSPASAPGSSSSSSSSSLSAGGSGSGGGSGVTSSIKEGGSAKGFGGPVAASSLDLQQFPTAASSHAAGRALSGGEMESNAPSGKPSLPSLAAPSFAGGGGESAAPTGSGIHRVGGNGDVELGPRGGRIANPVAVSSATVGARKVGGVGTGSSSHLPQPLSSEGFGRGASLALPFPLEALNASWRGLLEDYFRTLCSLRRFLLAAEGETLMTGMLHSRGLIQHYNPPGAQYRSATAAAAISRGGLLGALRQESHSGEAPPRYAERMEAMLYFASTLAATCTTTSATASSDEAAHTISALAAELTSTASLSAIAQSRSAFIASLLHPRRAAALFSHDGEASLSQLLRLRFPLPEELTKDSIRRQPLSAAATPGLSLSGGRSQSLQPLVPPSSSAMSIEHEDLFEALVRVFYRAGRAGEVEALVDALQGASASCSAANALLPLSLASMARLTRLKGAEGRRGGGGGGGAPLASSARDSRSSFAAAATSPFSTSTSTTQQLWAEGEASMSDAWQARMELHRSHTARALLALPPPIPSSDGGSDNNAPSQHKDHVPPSMATHVLLLLRLGRGTSALRLLAGAGYWDAAFEILAAAEDEDGAFIPPPLPGTSDFLETTPPSIGGGRLDAPLPPLLATGGGGGALLYTLGDLAACGILTVGGLLEQSLDVLVPSRGGGCGNSNSSGSGSSSSCSSSSYNTASDGGSVDRPSPPRRHNSAGAVASATTLAATASAMRWTATATVRVTYFHALLATALTQGDAKVCFRLWPHMPPGFGLAALVGALRAALQYPSPECPLGAASLPLAAIAPALKAATAAYRRDLAAVAQVWRRGPQTSTMLRGWGGGGGSGGGGGAGSSSSRYTAPSTAGKGASALRT